MSSVDLRPATLGDADAIARLAGELGYPVDRGEMERRLAICCASEDDGIFVASRDDQVVAWIHIQRRRPLLTNECPVEIVGLVVGSAARRQGVGRALLQAAETWARDRGFRMVRVRANVIRTEAHAFYESAGYRLKKQQKVFEKAL
ncbi:MAG: GNAT family N-acetyltransferase [Fimbriimonas ginsengisoli]|uniref:GNAT family N-acetyltransferase n=1 Tax=Fimbriimonas ginsengisoli TaxID=1005039 RepID=A0A931PU34_FIMGI|nr:GNAT family N-acetyltransferase [Fimbriimonas ginsengisoli]